MTQEQVVRLMQSSKSEREWNDNCSKVKNAFSGKYPSFWWSAIIVSGIADEIMKGFV